MKLMRNQIRPYPWGSRTALADLLGEPSPAPTPQAELWIGAHPSASSVLGEDPDQSLAKVITLDPVGTVGPNAQAAFGARLPFLLKVLAADEPLSLQAHPCTEHARSGFAREEAAGIPLSAPDRNYRDGSHKPELICALTDFHAMCGFRDPTSTLRLLAELSVPEIDEYVAVLYHQPDAEGLRALFEALVSLPPEALTPLLDAVVSACTVRASTGSPFAAEYRTAQHLADRYPADAGVLVSLLLNRITLHPGQALFLPAGNLHAYLSGVGVEITANSDNVLRGGLTSKHVDVTVLMAVVDFTPGDVPILTGSPTWAGEVTYPTQVLEFQLSQMDLDGQVRDITHPGPQVLLTVDGYITATDNTGQAIPLVRGQTLWIPSADRDVRITGIGRVFRATDGMAA